MLALSYNTREKAYVTNNFQPRNQKGKKKWTSQLMQCQRVHRGYIFNLTFWPLLFAALYKRGCLTLKFRILHIPICHSSSSIDRNRSIKCPTSHNPAAPFHFQCPQEQQTPINIIVLYSTIRSLHLASPLALRWWWWGFREPCRSLAFMLPFANPLTCETFIRSNKSSHRSSFLITSTMRTLGGAWSWRKFSIGIITQHCNFWLFPLHLFLEIEQRKNLLSQLQMFCTNCFGGDFWFGMNPKILKCLINTLDCPYTRWWDCCLHQLSQKSCSQIHMKRSKPSWRWNRNWAWYWRSSHMNRRLRSGWWRCRTSRSWSSKGRISRSTPCLLPSIHRHLQATRRQILPQETLLKLLRPSMPKSL